VRYAIKEIAEIYAFLTLALQAESEGIFKVPPLFWLMFGYLSW
jgi:hypothetical protein